MKKLLFIYSLLSATAAFATTGPDYTCLAKANPDRGLSADVDIVVSPAAVGGRIFLLANRQQRPLGIVSEVTTLLRDDAAQRPAFDLSLGYVAEQDVSGISEAALKNVSSISQFKAELPNGDEVQVIRLFAGAAQIGGTFMYAGTGTACLP